MTKKISLDYSLNLKKNKSAKSLCFFKKSLKGKNFSGKIVARHRGGGHKQLFRKINFRYNKFGTPGSILCFDYDPNRNSRITLLRYADGEIRYVLKTEGSFLGKKIITGPNVDQNIGNALPLAHLKLGLDVHSVELYPKSGAKICRSSGTFSKILAKNKNFAILRLPSKEIKTFSQKCFATIGQVNNSRSHLKRLSKAGQNRWRGIRPSVRGVAMNPIDHPHGGGEGKSPVGRAFPCTPWGKPAIGLKTRKNNKNVKLN